MSLDFKIKVGLVCMGSLPVFLFIIVFLLLLGLHNVAVVFVLLMTLVICSFAVFCVVDLWQEFRN